MCSHWFARLPSSVQSMMFNSADMKLLVAGLGELIWDVVGADETLGGAPVNFVYHAAQLGASALAISSIGDDLRGRRAISHLADHGVVTDHHRGLDP